MRVSPWGEEHRSVNVVFGNGFRVGNRLHGVWPTSCVVVCCVHPLCSCFFPASPVSKHNHSRYQLNSNTATRNMDLNVEFSDETYVIEVALDDTVEDMRLKVASAVGLPEDSFDMSFRDEVMGEGADITQLSAGDTIMLAKSTTKKFEAIELLRALGETNLTLHRLKRVQDPEVACLLLQAEVTTDIPRWFLGWTSLTRLDLSAVSTVTRIGNSFLAQCTSLTAVDLSSLNSLEHIGHSFLKNCSSLTAVDLSFNRLMHIGETFLCKCISLTALNLSFNNLAYIGNMFLSGCTTLSAVDFSSFQNVTSVGKYDFCARTNLQRIRLSGCSAVVSSAVEEANLSEFVVEARPKRKRDESPDEDCKRPRLSQ